MEITEIICKACSRVKLRIEEENLVMVDIGGLSVLGHNSKLVRAKPRDILYNPLGIAIEDSRREHVCRPHRIEPLLGGVLMKRFGMKEMLK